MVKKYYGALSLFINAVLLVIVLHQARRDSQVDSRSLTTVNMKSKPVIRTTKETLYAMYGEGNLTDVDEQLLNYIRSLTSRQGSGGRRLSSKSTRVTYSEYGGSQFVDELLKRRRNGFFVECGAFRGEELSDSLFFEKERNWTGILIEAHPEYHREILTKNRRALVLRACLSSIGRPQLVKFKLAGQGSGVTSLNRNVHLMKKNLPETDVQCFSLNSIMAAIGVQHIDFMILDVEGSELSVLHTIDWTRLSIDVFSIEYIGVNRTSKLEKIRHFFNATGMYKEVGKLPRHAADNDGHDVIFLRV